jgi:hypothetical protein
MVKNITRFNSGKVRLVFMLIFGTCCLNAQQSFAPLGATWIYSYADHIPYLNTFRPLEVSVRAVDMYQGQLCSELIFLPIPPYGSQTGSWAGDTVYIFEENDSVFYWSPYSQQFELLYDFTAEVGDSWVIGGLGVTDPGEYEDFLVVTIDSIGSVIVGNDTLKVWYHQESPYFDWGNAIIEGIGSNLFMIPSFGLYESRIGHLRCYEDITSDYQFVSYPCDTVIFDPIWSATENRSKETRVVFSPNPVQDVLHITSPEYFEDGVLRIIDLQGCLVHEENVTIPGTVDMSKLTPGVYFCNVMIGPRLEFIQRIVKVSSR